ncbi:transporter substrate-binding domain-containing protein [Paludibacterium purpuratum]|uniref:Amino acid ABC transporter substrate-binding protein (PAAT family) n=1 Tax=Paludibacterium purpuratum TaxID=1144873 RepID=A0A4R7B2G1_9NEIS|nr:transporter substrate-binding domain-containing protein [Paludibacterium purpuratum]TDR77906.1 amino acid ABC transporter substrate-binding protein (PAAT family) [Paludibacterium purpuratum]
MKSIKLMLLGWLLCLSPVWAAGVVRVGINASYAPFESVDDHGRLSGFDIDVVTAWAKTQGVTVKLVNLPWPQLLGALSDGRVDMVVSAVADTPERRARFELSQPYHYEPQVLLVPAHGGKDDVRAIDGIGVLIDSSAIGWLRRLRVPDAALRRYNGLPPMLADLKAGDLQGAFGDLHVLRRASAGDPSLRLVSRPDFGQDAYVFVVRKGDRALLTQANQGLARMTADGTLKRLHQSWPGL